MAASLESPTEPLPVKLVCGAANNASFKRFKKLHGDEETADVYFLTSKRIPAHKAILLAASDVFRRHFAGDWKDKDQVVIQDEDETAFQVLLGYIYKDEIEMNMKDLYQVLCMADRFNVQELVDKLFSQSVFEKYSPQLIWQYLTFAVIVKDAVKRELCLALVDTKATECFALHDFLKIGLDVMISLISRDTLLVKESDLFKACLEWSVAECGRQNLDVTPENQRQVMEPFIHEIRFPVMSLQEFEDFVESSKILTSQEVLLITKVMVSKDKASVGCGFKFHPRKAIPSSALKDEVNPNQKHISLWDQLDYLVCVAAIGYDKSRTRIACKSCKVKASATKTDVDYDEYGCMSGMPEIYNCAVGICVACEIRCHSHCEMGQRVMSTNWCEEASYGTDNTQLAVCSCPLDKCKFLKRAEKY